MSNFFAQADAAATLIPPGDYIAELCEACQLALQASILPEEARRTMLPLPAPGRLVVLDRDRVACEHRA